MALTDNPKRPPKHWWKGCVRGVRDSGSAASPEEVCGSLWYHKMSPAARRAALKTEGKKMLQENPNGLLENPYGIVTQDGIVRRIDYSLPDLVRWGQRNKAQYDGGLEFLRVSPEQRTGQPLHRAKHLTKSQRDQVKRIARESEGGHRLPNTNPCKSGCVPTAAELALAPNPNGGTLFLLAAAAAAGLYLILRSKPAAASEGGGLSCVVSLGDLDAWGDIRGYAVAYMNTLTSADAYTGLPQGALQEAADVMNAGGMLVLVLGGDNSFWVFTDPGGNALPAPVPAPAQKQDFCEWIAAGKPATGLPPGGPATCPVTAGNLNAWGSATGLPVAYLPSATSPLTPATLATVPGLPAQLEAGNVPLFVLGDGSFWTITWNASTSTWLPAPAPHQKDLFCSWIAQNSGSAPSPAPSPVQQATQFIPNV